MRAQYGLPIKWLNEVVSTSRSDCIEWPFGLNKAGYGYVRIGEKRQHAHRYVCLAAHGEPPSVIHTDVAHSCGNRKCCNPNHLRHATSAENSADAIGHGTVARGARHPAAKLTEADIPVIKRLLNSGQATVSQLARQYGVSHKSISFIRDGVNWGWVDAA